MCYYDIGDYYDIREKWVEYGDECVVFYSKWGGGEV